MRYLLISCALNPLNTSILLLAIIKPSTYTGRRIMPWPTYLIETVEAMLIVKYVGNGSILLPVYVDDFVISNRNYCRT